MKTLLDRWLALTEPFGFSARFVRWSFIASVSALLENKVWMFENGGDYVYPTMYVLLVGAPATFKTTTCNRVVNDLLKPIVNPSDGPFFGPSIATPAALIAQLRVNQQKNVGNNFKSSPMFLYAGEFSTLYRDIGGGEMTIDLLNFYDPLPPGECFQKALVKEGGAVEVISPALTLLGCTTQKNIIDSRMMSISGTGIVSRFIFVYEPKRPAGTADRPDIRNTRELETLRASFQVIRSMRGEYALSPEADIEFRRLVKRDRQWHHDNPADTLFAHYMARRATQLCKLSMCFAAISRKNLRIEAADVLAADAMLSDIEPDMPHAFGAQIQKNDASLMAKLGERIPATGISQSRLLRIFKEDGQSIPLGWEWDEAIRGMIGVGEIDSFTDPDSNEIIFRKKVKQ